MELPCDPLVFSGPQNQRVKGILPPSIVVARDFQATRGDGSHVARDPFRDHLAKLGQGFEHVAVGHPPLDTFG